MRHEKKGLMFGRSHRPCKADGQWVMFLGCPLGLGVALTVPVQEKGSVLVPLGENIIQDLQRETLEVTNEPSIQAPAGSIQGCLAVEGWDGPFGKAASTGWFPTTKAPGSLQVVKPGWTPSQAGHPSAVSTKKRHYP